METMLEPDGGRAVRRGTNLPSVAEFNQAVVLDQIRRARSVSRVELAGRTGLSAQTVSNICQRLLDEGLIEEAGRTSEQGKPGKPRTLLRLNPGSRFAVGVHIDPSVVTFSILDLSGRVVATERRATPAQIPAQEISSYITHEIERIVDRAGIERARIAGIGIAAPGPIDVAHGAIVDPPFLSGWHRVPLRDTVAEATGLPVVLEKDVTAAAVAELWMSEQVGASFAYLYLGTGLGVGLVVHDEVVRGGSGNAGEIGHIIVDPDGPPCSCGMRGCIAVTLGPADLVREAEEAGVLDAAGTGDDVGTIDDRVTALVDLAASGRPGAVAVLDRFAQRLARATAVVCNLLDVDRVVLGGPAWDRIGGQVFARVAALLDELRAARGVHRVEVEDSLLGGGSGAVGAACLVLDAVHTPRTSSLILQ